MSVFEILLILLIAFVLFDTKQLLQFVGFFYRQYKKLLGIVRDTKKEVEINLSSLVNIKSSKQIFEPFLYADKLSSCQQFRQFYQPEFDFDAQPELFDDLD